MNTNWSQRCRISKTLDRREETKRQEVLTLRDQQTEIKPKNIKYQRGTRWLFRIFNKRHRHACDSPQKRKCKFSAFASRKRRTDWPLVISTLKLQTVQPAQPMPSSSRDSLSLFVFPSLLFLLSSCYLSFSPWSSMIVRGNLQVPTWKHCSSSSK